MIGLDQILPETGRGTARRVVVGAIHLAHPRDDNARTIAPTTVFDGPPPRAGEDL